MTLVLAMDLSVLGENTSIMGKVNLACGQEIVAAIRRELENTLPDVEYIDRILFDVFSFSRGVAAARHFVNVIDQQDDHPLVQAVAKEPTISLKAGFDWRSRDDVVLPF